LYNLPEETTSLKKHQPANGQLMGKVPVSVKRLELLTNDLKGQLTKYAVAVQELTI
jgi:hypothetical protein